MVDAGSLRVGRDERELVVLALRQQYAEGRLRPEELQERMTMAGAARTFADLDALVVDLPIRPPSAELAGEHLAPSAWTGTGPGSAPDRRLTLSAGVSSHVRRGVWTVPPYLRVSAGLGTVKLDFQHAICPHPVVDVAVQGGLGTVVLVVPEGWGAVTERVGKGVGSVTNHVDEVPRPGLPLLVLHGTCAAGSVRVRYPRWGDRRAARRVARRGGTAAAGVPGGARGAGPSSTAPGGWSSGPQDAPPRPS